MQRLFQTFDRHAVRYLLISGQAAVLYGAHGSRVIDDLRRLRARGSLLEEGTPVRAILSS